MLFRRFSTRVLLTGATGQIGAELLATLQNMHGIDNVLGTDIKEPSKSMHPRSKYEIVDVSNAQNVQHIFQSFKPKVVYHMASTLSAPSELDPKLALNVNINGIHNILDNARHHHSRVFAPSTVGAYGPSSPKVPADIEI